MLKLTIKIMLIVSIFSSVVLADGDMGSGGKSCPNGQTCRGAIETTETTVENTCETDSILNFIRDYLFSIFG
jgi:hypothetical protein